MRWWRQRRSFMPAEPPSEDLLATEEALRTSIGDILSINDRQIRGGVIIFRGTLTIDAARASTVLRERFRPYGYTPYVRTGPAGVVVQAWPTADTAEPPRVALSVALFAFTCLSTLL